jgi:hypothetical protein
MMAFAIPECCGATMNRDDMTMTVACLTCGAFFTAKQLMEDKRMSEMKRPEPTDSKATENQNILERPSAAGVKSPVQGGEGG